MANFHPAQVRIIDGFTFYNEVDMLELRLRYLYPYVNEFIVVEADHKFNGDSKPFLLKDLMASKRFSSLADKVTVRSINIDTSRMNFMKRPSGYDPTADFWKIEAAQRNAIRSGEVRDNDFFLMGDLDEIPNATFLLSILYSEKFRSWVREAPRVFRQKCFYYNLHCLKDDRWHGTIVLNSASSQSMTNQEVRDRRYDWLAIDNGGWHFSYFMSPEQIADKIGSFSHQEYNTDYMRSKERIAEMIASKKDIFERDEKFLPFDASELPLDIRRLLNEKFSHLGVC